MTREPRRVVVLTGAGISADSGLATFRDAGGLWEGRRPEEVATPEAWAREPETVWRFYQLRRRALLGVEPNGSHRALVEFERRSLGRGWAFTLLSQNVDDLHARAGSRPLSMHGQLLELRCETCGRVTWDTEHLEEREFVACGGCGHPRLRPNVVWFGEQPLFLDEVFAAASACTDFVCCGTSGAVYPAAGLIELARRAGARCWVQALEPPDNLSSSDRWFEGRAVEVLPGLLDELGA